MLTIVAIAVQDCDQADSSDANPFLNSLFALVLQHSGFKIIIWLVLCKFIAREELLEGAGCLPVLECQEPYNEELEEISEAQASDLQFMQVWFVLIQAGRQQPDSSMHHFNEVQHHK